MQVTSRSRLPLLALLVIYWAIFSFFTLHNPLDIFGIDNVSSVQHTQIITTAHTTYNTLPKNEPLRNIQLPHDWLNDGIEKNSVWYISHFTAENKDLNQWAVYLPSVTHNAAVYINGIWVGHGSPPQNPVARHHNRPLFFEFSNTLLDKQNEVAIRVDASHARQGLMGKFYISQADKLRSAYEKKLFWRVEIIQWVTVTMLFTSIIIFSFWASRPKDKTYGIFSLMLFIWAIHNLNLFVIHIPFSARLWEALIMATLGWTVVLMIFFNHRYLGDSAPFFEKSAFSFAIVGLGIFFLPDLEQVLFIGYLVWDSFLIIFGIYAIFHLSRAFWRQRDFDIYLMLLAGIPILVFGLHDILIVNHVIDRTEGLIIQYSAIPALTLFTWFLIRRFVNSVNDAEQLNATLEQRISQKEQEIQTQFTRLREFENHQLLASERDRIMRDMHDGLGGQLLSLKKFVTSKKGEEFSLIKQKLNHSLIDLRIVIDSLDPTLGGITTLMGNLRNRLEQQLTGTGIQLLWHIKELPEKMLISPQKNLHLMRIIQEAVNNSTKHSNTESVTIETDIDDKAQYFFIIIKDQGYNNSNPVKEKGRGLENMRYRANQLNGHLDININQKGTTVTLSLPLDT